MEPLTAPPLATHEPPPALPAGWLMLPMAIVQRAALPIHARIPALLWLAAGALIGASVVVQPLYAVGGCGLITVLGLLSTCPRRAPRRFSYALLGLLLGYMFLARGFAYIGAGPVHVGELVLILGLLALPFRSGRLASHSGFLRLLLVLVGMLMVVGALGTIPYLGEYGLSSLRDSAIWGYAAFAVLVYLIVDGPGQLAKVMHWYRLLIPIFLVWAALAQVMELVGANWSPLVPGTDVPIINLKPGDAGVHLAAIAAILLVGPPRTTSDAGPPAPLAWPHWLLWSLWVIDSILVAINNRGGALAILLVIAFLLVTLRSGKLLIPLTIGLLLFLGAATLDIQVGTIRGRSISTEQLKDNVLSVIDSDRSASLDGTRTWRLEWWKTILGYTLHGDYFWTGKGYGVNLADDDGFQVYDDHSLRSPHSAHLTFLARSGVPGALLWVLLQAAFMVAMVSSRRRYRRMRDIDAAGLCIVVLCYWMAALVNSAFDVYLEGPHGGIWFWSVFGAGLVLVGRPGLGSSPASGLVLDSSEIASKAQRDNRTDAERDLRARGVTYERMDAHDRQRILRKRKGSIIAITLACTIAALVASIATTPIYESKAILLVVAKNDHSGDVSTAYQGTLLSQQLVKSFAQILTSRATADAALRLDPQSLTPRQLQGKIKARPVAETLLIELSVEDADPTRARRLTNSVARAFIQKIPILQGGSALRVSMVEPPLTATEPIRPRTKLNIALGLLLGVMLGVGTAFLRELLDRSVKTPEQLEAAVGVPVVGTIPPFKATKQPIPVAEQPRGSAAEAFRKLRTNFAFLGVDRENLCCVVTSPASGDGKSTVTANLGIALAQAGQRVAVIDADLRKPSQHKIFGLHQRVGTTTVLLDQAAVTDAIQYPSRDLPAVLTSGQLPPNPSELLGSRRMAQLVAELRSMFDIVLIDCAPLLPVTDPMVVSQFADGILLIAKSGMTTKDQTAAARTACAKAGATIFGTVLNATSVTEGDQPAYYAYYGEADRQEHGTDRNLDLVAANANTVHRVEGNRAARRSRVRAGTR
jgi:capsular exopolysaccharide synthesis family protein